MDTTLKVLGVVLMAVIIGLLEEWITDGKSASDRDMLDFTNWFNQTQPKGTRARLEHLKTYLTQKN